MIDSIEVNGFDLEGIAIIQDSIIAAILERDRKVLLLDKRGNEISSFTIDISGESNKGIEGITYSSKENIIYIINEKKPRVLIKADLSGKIIMKIPLDFAKDFSGLHYDENSGLLWIISDEDSAIFICTTEGVLIQKVRLNIEQIEGIALDNVNSLVYIVSDPLEKLYIFKLQ